MSVELLSDDVLQRHRRELTGHCYRMLGSAADADDAVQETLVRAWRHRETFAGRSSARTWLYRIATHVCLDALRTKKRRERPMDLGPAGKPAPPVDGPRPELPWLGPIDEDSVIAADGDPATIAVQRESIRLAFVAALQHLPPKQRATLLLRELLGLSAEETAATLETSVPSVNSALQRARATLDQKNATATDTYAPLDDAHHALLNQYVQAFERYDLDALGRLLRDDAILNMPPFPLWLQGPADIRAWMEGSGGGCRGSRLVVVKAFAALAVAQYRPANDGGFVAWALQIVETKAGRIATLNNFLETAVLFPRFGLPLRLDA